MRKTLIALFCLLASPVLAEKPVVVFLPGLGDGAESFRPVIRRMEGRITAIADARPRRSPGKADGSLTPAEAARELHGRLQAKGAAPPYVLVAHSLAGLHALEFARLYPGETTALLLADARLPGFDARCRAEGLPICTVPPALFALLPASQQAELRGAEAMLSAPARPGRWAGVPMTLVVATQPAPGLSQAFQKVWRAHAAGFAKALPAARMVPAKGAGHYVQQEAPGLVVAELAALIAAQR